MITNTKYARKLLAAQDKRRALTADETMLETALLQAAVLTPGTVAAESGFEALKQHMADNAEKFWDYLNFAVVATADSFGVRPGTWFTRTPEEISSIIVPLTASPEDSRTIRAAVEAVSEALIEREGAASEEFTRSPDGELLLKMARLVSILATSRARSKKLAPALVIKGVRRVTDEYHKAHAK